MDKLTYQAQGRKKMLKERAKRCVCRHCGGPLHLRQLIFSREEDARIEIFCHNCDRIEFGVEQEIYESAKYFVDQTGFNFYPELDDTENTRRMNIAKVAEIMTWENKMLGFLDDDGFTTEPHKTPYMGELMRLTDDEVGKIETIYANAPSN